ncbi:MAG: hypothetical protein ACXWH0_09550 [Acidimicrobiia bacterium]
MRIDSGMPLPDRLVEALAAGAEAGIVAFLSETCWDLAGELGRFRGGPVLAFFAGHVSGAMRSRLGEGVRNRRFLPLGATSARSCGST